MLTNRTRHTTLASHVDIAQSPWQRMKGLLGMEQFPLGKALVITRCQSIHMFFMKFPIDVIFCDRNNQVVGLCEGIKPFGLSPIFFKAAYAVELPVGSIASSKTQIGDQVQF